MLASGFVGFASADGSLLAIAEKAFGRATIRVVYVDRKHESGDASTFVITAMWK